MISICIASYNQSKWLPDAIESVLNQEFYTGDLELIIVDDGSTDNSLEIANQYWSEWAKEKNKYFVEGKEYSKELKDFKVISQVNKGLASARNTGIMNANGEWFFPLDADDILMPLCMYKIREVIQVFNPPDIIAPSFHNFGVLNNDVILDNPTHQDFMTANRIGYFSAIRKSKLLEIGGYSPRMTWGYEDYHLWHNLLKRGATLHTLKEVLVLYRTKPNSMLSTAQQHHEELIAQINKDFYAKP